MKDFHLSKKFWMAFATLGAVALAFGYYFLVHVKNQEDEFYAKRFRSLKRMGSNVPLLIEDYKKLGEFKIDENINFQNYLIEAMYNDIYLLWSKYDSADDKGKEKIFKVLNKQYSKK